MQSNSSGVAGLKPATTQKASEVIYEQLSELITSGQILPGERLPAERELIVTFGRSRPTVREALRMLEQNGLIKTVPGSGAIVTSPSVASASAPLEAMLTMEGLSRDELLEYRRFNDIAFTIWAAERRDESDLERIETCIAMMRRYEVSNEIFVDWYSKFLVAVATAGRNRLSFIINNAMQPVVKNALLQTLAALPPEGVRANKDRILRALEKVCDSIRAQNFKAASESMKQHLHDIQQDNAAAVQITRSAP